MQQVGVIGIGHVGKRLVESLIEGGYEVVCHDVDPDKRSFATANGAEWAQDPARVAANCEAAITAVPGVPEVEAVFEGESGLFETLGPGQLVVDVSTVGPDAATAVADLCGARDVAFLTAPLTLNAPAGGLHMMIGGTEADYERAAPLLDTVSEGHRRIGSPAAAQTFKLGLQLRYACREAVDAEVVAFARDHDLDPAIYREFLELDVDPRYLEREFAKDIEGLGGRAIWQKDLGYAQSVAREGATATPILDAVLAAYDHASRVFGADAGHATAILRHWERLNGAE
jgi:3-hydroxyisobutyrate dehydrogenase-like beta-hydroxyacid dehydrogenase